MDGLGRTTVHEGGDICILIADSHCCIAEVNPTQHYKAIILQLKINFKKCKKNGNIDFMVNMFTGKVKKKSVFSKSSYLNPRVSVDHLPWHVSLTRSGDSLH